MKSLFALLLVGCATNAGVVRHQARQAYVIDSVEILGVRPGVLASARESWRPPPGDDPALRDRLIAELGRAIPFSTAAPEHLRVRVVLQDAGENEGLAAETADVTLVAEVVDSASAELRTITLREPASAPLQRSRSSRARLEQALSRLVDRLAQQL